MTKDRNKIEDPAEQRVVAGEAIQHPGPFFRDEVFPSFGIKITDLAKRISMDRSTLSEVMNGKLPMSDTVAYKLEAATGIDADLLISMQAAHNRWANKAQREAFGASIERLAPKEATA